MKDYLVEIKTAVADALQQTYDITIAPSEVVLQLTKKEFEGDFTVVVFPWVRQIKQKPEAIADAMGQAIIARSPQLFAAYNVVKGFLNFSLQDTFWVNQLSELASEEDFGQLPPKNEKVLVEFSSPNTNKPLHLGHIRNIVIGWSVTKILQAAGYDVATTQIVNDRGIAICKSMVAWQRFGNGETPESTGKKGDHFVGEYYVLFERHFQEEYTHWQEQSEGKAVYDQRKDKAQEESEFFKKYKNTYFNEHSSLGKAAKEMLVRWEQKDAEIRSLWQKMNGWVYQGFDTTYDALGVSFDSMYYESDTYLLGRDLIERGMEESVFYRKEDGSVWVDLTDVGMDHKILLRSDGTSVYMTQDLGTAEQRYRDQHMNKMVYVVADEQDYHFKVLFEILKRLKAPYAAGLFHLSYGMVDLPSGRMKSREGTVVDADDLIAEVIGEVEKNAVERGELVDLSDADRQDIYNKIGLAALKYFILKVNPKKRMIFNPEESVDIQGHTGPYIQNAYVRIRSIQRKMQDQIGHPSTASPYTQLDPTEKEIVKLLIRYEEEIHKAAEDYDPAVIAAYAYELARAFHRFYHDVRILKAETENAMIFRMQLADQVARVLRSSMNLLGVKMPERM